MTLGNALLELIAACARREIELLEREPSKQQMKMAVDETRR